MTRGVKGTGPYSKYKASKPAKKAARKTAKKTVKRKAVAKKARKRYSVGGKVGLGSIKPFPTAELPSTEAAQLGKALDRLQKLITLRRLIKEIKEPLGMAETLTSLVANDQLANSLDLLQLDSEELLGPRMLSTGRVPLTASQLAELGDNLVTLGTELGDLAEMFPLPIPVLTSAEQAEQANLRG